MSPMIHRMTEAHGHALDLAYDVVCVARLCECFSGRLTFASFHSKFVVTFNVHGKNNKLRTALCKCFISVSETEHK